MPKLTTLILLAIVSASLPIHAAPAPWFKWYSLYDGAVICSQTWPGEGWEKGVGPYGGNSGPFKDAMCTKSGMPDH